MLPFVATPAVRASDQKNFKHRIFVDVERVFISVEDGSYAIKPEDVPPVLRKANLEKLLLDAYRERFSPTECQKWLDNRNPYSCDNQPVVVVPESESSAYNLGHDTTFASHEELRDPGTLNVVLQVAIHGNTPGFEPPLVGPMVTFQLIQDRPQSDIPLLWRVPPVLLVPLDQGPDAIRDRLLRYIGHRIK